MRSRKKRGVGPIPFLCTCSWTSVLKVQCASSGTSTFMDISVVYFLVLLFSTVLWTAISLRYRLYLWTLNIITVRRRKLSVLNSLYESDDAAFGKCTPSRVGRGIITLIVILENVLMIFLPLKSTKYSLYTFSSRCGKLAAVNLIWSLVLRFQIIKACVLNASTFQADVWVSALLLWLSWHETLTHIILSFGHLTLRVGEAAVTSVYQLDIYRWLRFSEPEPTDAALRRSRELSGVRLLHHMQCTC